MSTSQSVQDDRRMRKQGPPRQYAVGIEIWNQSAELLVTARSRSGAKYAAWLEVSEPTGVEFGRFARECVQSVRLSGRRTAYDYVRLTYGIDVAAGDRVRCRCREEVGVVAEPPGSNPHTNYVYVILGDSPPRPWHGSDVTPA